jgi:hypothetical protein
MYILPVRWRRLILGTVVCLTCTRFVTASDEPTLTKDQIKQFLLTAKVVKSEHTKKGITDPWRLTLTDGTVTHDASRLPRLRANGHEEWTRGAAVQLNSSVRLSNCPSLAPLRLL